MKRSHFRGNFRLILLFSTFFLSTASFATGDPGIDFNSLPVKGMVTMIDLGAKSCIPCKMMAPIMEKMEKNYEGRAAVVFIDVWENREQAPRFKIRSIPTQIFFDADGKEVYRHVGFMAEKDIVEKMTQLGVSP